MALNFLNNDMEDETGMTEKKLSRLLDFADTVKKRYEQPRQRNGNEQDEWTIVPRYWLKILSESTALIVFDKKNSGKRCLIWCYWIAKNGGQWEYFIPTYDILYGMTSDMVKQMMMETEQHNAGIGYMGIKQNLEGQDALDEINRRRNGTLNEN